MSEPVYTITLAFEAGPVARCVGLRGLIETVPGLEVGLYFVRDDRGRLVGKAERHTDTWSIEVDGVQAGPGYIVI
jgi:hypothetical protein